jgi:hypothetical protein
VVLGLKAEQITSDKAEETVLINFIANKFGGYTVQEIRTAFEMAVAGELNIESKDVNLYGGVFSCEYLARIMKAYQSHRGKVLEEIRREDEKKIKSGSSVTNANKRKNMMSIINDMIIPAIDEFNETGVLDFGLIQSRFVFELFEKAKIITMNQDEKKAKFKEHLEKLKANWEEEIKKPIVTKEQSDMKKKFEKALRGDEKSFRNRRVIERMCHSLLQEICKSNSKKSISSMLSQYCFSKYSD